MHSRYAMTISKKALQASMPDAFPAKVGQKNRVYLPQEVAKGLGIEPGDYVIIRLAGKTATIEKLK